MQRIVRKSLTRSSASKRPASKKNTTIKSGVGGWRPGSGRPKGSKNKATVAEKATISELARAEGPACIKRLAYLREHAKSEPAQAQAASALLDRGYGKPPQSLEHKGSGPGGSVAIVDALQLAKLEPEELALFERLMAKLASAGDVDSDQAGEGS